MVNRFAAAAVAFSLILVSCPVIKTDAAAKKPKLSTTRSVLERGEKKTLKVKKNGNKISKVTWKTTDAKVAKVSAKGKVTATGVGSATVKASFKVKGAKKKTTLKCNIDVYVWKTADDLTVTDEVRDLVKKVTETAVGASFEPQEILATQMEYGHNYRILCKTTGVVQNPTPYYTILEINLTKRDDPVGFSVIAETENIFKDVPIATDISMSQIAFDPSWEYGDKAKITSGVAKLYKVTSKSIKGKTVCVNAGHGTKGGTDVKVPCHPDGSPKIVSGSTAAGKTEAVAVGAGMTFEDGMKESEATLKAAMVTKEELLESGYNVLMIRESDDIQLDNLARTLIANNYADCHIAIHYDGPDNRTEDKGVFFCSVPAVESYRNMEPVKTWWQEHNRLGECAVNGLVSAGLKKWNDGQLEMDLTQTSFSTVPSIDLEVGNQCSDRSFSQLQKIAEGIRIGVDSFFYQQ